MKRQITYIITIIILTTTSNHAKVFWRWNTTAESDNTIESIGGKVAYSAPVELNGGNGTLTVYSFAENINTVTKTLCRTFNTDKLKVKNSSMAMATITDNGTVLNLIAISMQPGGPTTLFKFEQTSKEAASSKTPPQNPIKEIKQFPGSQTTFYAKDKETKAALAVTTAKTTVQAALDFYSSELPADGWSAPLSSANNHNPTGKLLLYQKNNQLCCIFAKKKANTKQTNITILYKILSQEMPLN